MKQLGHPHREAWHRVGHQFKQRFHLRHDEQEKPDPLYPSPPHGTCRVQVVRSVSDWSHGVLKEDSIQNACSFLLPLQIRTGFITRVFLDCQLIREANHFIYIGMLLTDDRFERLLTVFSRKPVLVQLFFPCSLR